MNRRLIIIVLAIISCDAPKSQDLGKSWMTAPDQETLEPGVTYVREKGAELEFIKYNLDPRDIAKKQVLPFRDLFQEIIKKKDFSSLVHLSMFIADDVGKKMGGLSYLVPSESEVIDKNWINIFKKTGKDPYCDYDKLLKLKYQGIEMMPYAAQEPRVPPIAPDKVFYKVTYLVRINPDSKIPHSFFIEVNYDNYTADKRYYILRYNNHCPIPNLIPEVDEHDYHLKPE